MFGSGLRSAKTPCAALIVLWCLACLPQVAQAEEEVRIAISADKSRVVIEGEDLKIFDGDIGDRLAANIGPTKCEIGAVRGQVRVFGGKLSGQNAKRLFFEASDGIRVDGRLFLGRIAAHVKGRKVIVINRLPLETYLLGIVGSEMNPDWPLDALKAQAVAARTYALQRRMRMRSANRPYDLESTVLSQVYKGAERIRPSVIDAVSLTRGEVLSHRHRLVEALFHSTCGGRTSSSREAFGTHLDYLVPRRCRWCKNAKRYRWKSKISLKKLERSLKKNKLIKGHLETLYRKAGQKKTTAVVDGKKKYLTSRSVRVAVGYMEIFSSKFEAKTAGKAVQFSGRGFGHGVGMCQWGAHGLSLDGHNYLEILAYYYQGTKIVRAY
jgi:stage II sporulation protein D